MIYNSFKVHLEDPIYGVNKKKNVVYCVANVSVDTPYANTDDVYINFYPKGSIKNKVVGVAKCSPNDNFDIEIGKRIAYARAENNAYKMVSNWVNEPIKFVNQMSLEAARFQIKAQRCIDHNKDYIDALTNPENPSYKVLLEKRNKKKNGFN